MSEKYSLNDVWEIIYNEGLWYALEHYMSGEDIKDKKLAEMWDNTRNFLIKTKKEIIEYIENNKGSE